MGKVRSAKAVARELRQKIYDSKNRRKALEKYLENLKINYEAGLISIEETVTESVANSILKLIEKPESRELAK